MIKDSLGIHKEPRSVILGPTRYYFVIAIGSIRLRSTKTYQTYSMAKKVGGELIERLRERILNEEESKEKDHRSVLCFSNNPMPRDDPNLPDEFGSKPKP